MTRGHRGSLPLRCRALLISFSMPVYPGALTASRHRALLPITQSAPAVDPLPSGEEPGLMSQHPLHHRRKARRFRSWRWLESRLRVGDFGATWLLPEPSPSASLLGAVAAARRPAPSLTDPPTLVRKSERARRPGPLGAHGRSLLPLDRIPSPPHARRGAANTLVTVTGAEALTPVKVTQLLYVTTDELAVRRTVAVATVVHPLDKAPSATVPLVSYQAAYDGGSGAQCEPAIPSTDHAAWTVPAPIPLRYAAEGWTSSPRTTKGRSRLRGWPAERL